MDLDAAKREQALEASLKLSGHTTHVTTDGEIHNRVRLRHLAREHAAAAGTNTDADTEPKNDETAANDASPFSSARALAAVEAAARPQGLSGNVFSPGTVPVARDAVTTVLRDFQSNTPAAADAATAPTFSAPPTNAYAAHGRKSQKGKKGRGDHHKQHHEHGHHKKQDEGTARHRSREDDRSQDDDDEVGSDDEAAAAALEQRVLFDGLTVAQVRLLSTEERVARWGFTEAELDAAAKVTERLSDEYELFVGDPLLAMSGLLFRMQNCGQFRRRFPQAHKEMKKARRKAAGAKAAAARAETLSKSKMDSALVGRTQMKRQRDTAMAKALDGYGRTKALRNACRAALTGDLSPEAATAAQEAASATVVSSNRRRITTTGDRFAGGYGNTQLNICDGSAAPILPENFVPGRIGAGPQQDPDSTDAALVDRELEADQPTVPSVGFESPAANDEDQAAQQTSMPPEGVGIDMPGGSADGDNDDDDEDEVEKTAEEVASAQATIAKAHEVLSALRPGEEAFYSRSRRCYVCKKPFRRVHFFYHAMCEKCAAFNHAKRGQTRELAGKVVVLTGCRIKIGFAMALLLLRCGATLVGTTRFPTEARARFMQEADYGAWAARLHLFALDMRDLPVVHHFCAFLEHTFPQGIFALINNAAQTIARPPGYFAAPLKVEAAPPAPCVAEAARDGAGVQWAQVHAQCARLRPGEAAFAPAITGDAEANAPTAGVAPPVPAITRPAETIDGDEDEDATAAAAPPGSTAVPPSIVAAPADNKPAAEAAVYDRYDFGAEVMDTRSVNSWVMRLTDVPCGEALEVMLINAIAPMVLCARLRPLLAKRSALETAALERGVEVGVRKTKGKCGACPDGDEGQPEERATKMVYDVRSAALAGAVEKRFVVNVSAMEGQFYRMKQTTHPHTNMAKAALNMMTRTSAVDYLGDGIFMNAVDTGWVTDEAPRGGGLSVEQRQALRLDVPLDEVDGAMRCLDPILADSARYGKFLKDYHETLW